jgi:hypothetical protein
MMRVSPARFLVAALSTGAVTLAVTGASASAVTSPRQSVKNAITATKSAHSVRVAGSIDEGSQKISLNVSATTSGVGQGTVGIGTGTVQVRLVGGTIYFMGNAAFWTQQSGASASKLFAGKWVDTAATTTSGKSLAEFLDSADLMKQLFSSNLNGSRFANAGRAKVGGRPAVVISGADKKNKTSGRLYIAARGKPYILKLTIGGKSGTGGLTFSHYNQPVSPVAPSGAIDLDTLSTG